MAQHDFEALYARYARAIRGIARKYGGSDDDLVRDLEQEGALILLQLETSRVQSNESAFVRNALRNRMIDYLRKQHLGSFESLDARLETGDQLERDEESGELTLFTGRLSPPTLLDEETTWESLEENVE